MGKLNWPGKRILIIEDDTFSFEFIRVSLRGRGLEILHATDGEQAFSMFMDTGGIDLILLDIQIPSIDGYTLCRMIRETGSTVPIIAQTAFALNDEKAKCEAAGCNAYLSKPLDIEKMINTIDRFMT
jgi:CheY-like chemotaxis protein